ncbi:uncharacterized protein [Oscarella lobularis]|uniref:uncharacterized protein isoform X2 n=1 Tax=Oscarella lobularis TaxID=121494 RepID=UPI0033130A34
MADPKWEELRFPNAVSLLSIVMQQDDGDIFLDLLEDQGLLTFDDKDFLCSQSPTRSGTDDMASQLLDFVFKSPSGSYEKFYEVLCGVKGGKDLIDRIERHKSILKEALASGSVPINRYRVMVVGQDGAGKSCLIDSFLDRPFKPQNPSTDSIAIHMAVTAAEGKTGQHPWRQEEYEKAQHLNKYLAAGYVITERQHQATALNQAQAASCAKETGAATYAKKRKLHQRKSRSDETELDQHIEEITKNEKLTSEQHQMIAEYLRSSEALASLEKFDVISKFIWDLGGQERYLTSHTAFMPTAFEYPVCIYLLVFDISKGLSEKAKSSYRFEGTSAGIAQESSIFDCNKDFLQYWFTSIGISHPSDMPSPYLGKDLGGVNYPAVLIVATHIDKVKRLPNCEEILKSQNAELHKLITDSKCEDHIVRNRENGLWFFPVDNTKSGETKPEERCEGVTAIASLLDKSSKHYWCRKDKARLIPVAWLRFELYLLSWRMGKIISVETAIKLAYRVGIKYEDEALLALMFLHNLGVIFYFWDVSELANCVIVDPKWLINTVAAFVTAKGPGDDKFERRWRNLCKTGKFSREMVLNKLTEAKVDPRDQEPVLEVLRMLDIVTDSPEASSTFFIPCMLSQKPTGPSVWEKYSPSEEFPPPIIIFPEEVKTIPEVLFFRIVTKCARKYPKGCKLTRSRCHFRIPNNLVLELLFYDRGACLIVSMNGEGDMEEARSSVLQEANVIGQFIFNSVESAKKRGMTGLKFKFYYQVTKCVQSRTSESGDETETAAGNLSCQLPNDDCLVERPENCKPGSLSVVILNKSGQFIVKEHLKLVHRWYKKESVSSRQDRHRALFLRQVLKRKPSWDELNTLSDAIASDWKPLARRLSIPDTKIDQIESDCRRCREQAYQALKQWMERESNSASVETLCRALCKEGWSDWLERNCTVL